MKKYFITLFFAGITVAAFPQRSRISYQDSLIRYRNNYIMTHEVVKQRDRKYFRFYPVHPSYNLVARFEKSLDTSTVILKTSGRVIPEKYFYRYGKIYFTLHKKECCLTLFQSKMLMADSLYKDYLFLPFTDSTTGTESYGSGRYIDVLTTDILDNRLIVDFNKAYNPYCTYSTGYNCPIPPKENRLTVFIKAGEKNFAKHH